MTNRKLTTVIGAILMALAAILQGFDINIGEEQISTITNSLVALIGAILAIVGPSVKPPKGTANLLLITLLPAFLVGGISTQFMGCQTIRDNPTLFRLGVKALTYVVLRENPSLESNLAIVADVLQNPQGVTSPESLEAMLHVRIDQSGGLVEGEKLVLKDFATELIGLYRPVYESNLGKIEDSGLLEILDAIGDAIAFVTIYPPDDTTVADSGTKELMTPAGLVLIE